MAPEIIRNLYKAQGVFTCHHPAHKQFGYEVSPYHIFLVKKCHPSGCVEFLWRCHQLEKGHPCPRKYKHVGRGCASCKYYHEDKLTYSPESPLEKEEIAEFVDELREYQGWLEGMSAGSCGQGKVVEFSGKIDGIAPHLEMHLDERGNHVSMDGFYLAFERGHIGQDLFDDRLYMKIFGNLLERYDFAPGDHIECRAVFTETRGRIILQKPSRIEHTRNGGKRHVNVSRALVGRATGKIISTGSCGQSPADLCNSCPYMSLIDVEDVRRRKPVYYRRYYCLRGLTDPETCPVRLGEILEQSHSGTKRVRRF